MKKCDWQGYGFGAAYQDPGCVEGMASDLDNCEHTNEGPMICLGDEYCPQCQGTGEVEDDAPSLGVMALHRQRAKSELQEHLDNIASGDLSPEEIGEEKAEIEKHLDGMFKLINKLEANTATAGA